MLLLSKPEESSLLRAGLASLQLSSSLTVTHIVHFATVIGYVNSGCRKAWSETDALLCQMGASLLVSLCSCHGS